MNRRGFWPYCLSGALIVLAAAGLTFLLHHAGLFDRWENDNLDRWLLSKQPRQSEDIVLVVIDENDYRARDLFDSQSPLKPQGVLEIIKAIAAGKPKVIGVDLDTSQWAEGQVTQFKQFKDERFKKGVGFPQVVWARDGWTENGQFQMAPVLGDDPQDICYGLPALRVDDDGIVRRFFPVYNPAGAPGFSTTVKRLYLGGQNCNDTAARSGGVGEENEQLIDFLGSKDSFRRLPASSILRLQKIQEWQTGSDFKDKIVLLGGTYRAARDRHATPVGMMDGVEVLAHAIQTELSGRPTLTEANTAVYLAADIAVGLTLVVVLYPLPSAWRIIALLSSVLLAILASLLIFHTSGYFFSFVPVIAGVRVHQVIEQYFEGRELMQENQELRRKLARRDI